MMKKPEDNSPKYKNIKMITDASYPHSKNFIPININKFTSSSQRSLQNKINKQKIKKDKPQDFKTFLRQPPPIVPVATEPKVIQPFKPVDISPSIVFEKPYENKNLIKNKVTVIIPTLQVVFNEITCRMVESICNKTTFVYEIIIVNNANTDMMTEKLQKYTKVRVVNDLPNLYVNSAWNYGISQCSTEYYCLLNDDVVFHPELLDSLVKFLTNSPHLNVTTVATHVFGHRNKVFEKLETMTRFNGNLEHEIKHYPKTIKQGWFLFGRTKYYVPIEIQYTGEIMNGDDWILQRNMEQFKSVVLIKNNLLIHAESSTVLTVQDNLAFIKRISK